jgi:hypothetical protein
VAEVAALVIRLSLALWAGGSLLVVMTAPVVFRQMGSRDLAGAVFGEILRRFEAVKQVLSLLLVIALFVRLEQGVRLEGRAVAATVGIFLAVATNVYLSMVVRPRMNYFRMKTGSFDTAPPEDPWRRRFDRLHRRSTRVLVLGWLAAVMALVLGP